ncbi:hypothetical protein A8C56_11260 [Niabella ginsenosidivorans]|uniref:Hydrolase n=1 Tax=Niabella ginsenosidivorans TaxID=1176587 RepID=A0A1A9I476_9BACT|nr:SGNH/GDSL hydrolase family protein [Niabella ginsenosidivorans]ANH81481.1 hypothetical protein A8C56_11260 [Niabella ginsenosidivorans]
MKKLILMLCAFLCFISGVAYSQSAASTKFVDGARLTIVGKAFPASFPFHRVDTAVYKGMSKSENQQARCSAGLAILFKTNSAYIKVLPSYKWTYKKDNMTGIAAAGFDLYIKKGNRWEFAGNGVSPERDKEITLVSEMDAAPKECLLYLPIYSELKGLKIGVEDGATIAAIPNPFKIKTVVFGSSYTQGISASRPGMSYPMQLQRNFNLDVCNLGFSGNSKLQPYFAKMLAAVKADVIVLDAFSNPGAELISERLPLFLDVVARSHKDIPVVFVETIYRGNADFNNKIREFESQKRNIAKALMKELIQKYPNVYFIDSPLPESVSHDTTADGIHPSDLGYFTWSQNLGKKLMEILKKQAAH